MGSDSTHWHTFGCDDPDSGVVEKKPIPTSFFFSFVFRFHFRTVASTVPPCADLTNILRDGHHEVINEVRYGGGSRAECANGFKAAEVILDGVVTRVCQAMTAEELQIELQIAAEEKQREDLALGLGLGLGLGIPLVVVPILCCITCWCHSWIHKRKERRYMREAREARAKGCLSDTDVKVVFDSPVPDPVPVSPEVLEQAAQAALATRLANQPLPVMISQRRDDVAP